MSHPFTGGKKIPAHLAFDRPGFNQEMSSSSESDDEYEVEEKGTVAPPPAKQSRRRAPAKPPAASSTGMKSPKKGPVSLTLDDGRAVIFNGPVLSRPENVPQSSALAGLFGTGMFLVITVGPTVETPLNMPGKSAARGQSEGREKSRSGSIDSRVRAYIVQRRAECKASGQPLPHISDICGYLLWIPTSGAAAEMQIYRYFTVKSDGATHIVLGTNGVEKDGPADIKEPQDVLDRAKPIVGALIADKRISTKSAPADCVLAVGVAPDPASTMFVDGAPMRPLMSSRRLMALAEDTPNKKATNARVPPPERFESAETPPPTPFLQPAKRKRDEEPAEGALFPLHNPFIQTVFAPTCPPPVSARAHALFEQWTAGTHEWGAFTNQLLDLAENATGAGNPAVYESIAAGLEHMRTAGSSDRRVVHTNSAVIFATMVLLPRFLDTKNEEVRLLCGCGKNMSERFEKTILMYLPEMAAYLRENPPHPLPETPMYRAYEIVAELAAYCMNE